MLEERVVSMLVLHSMLHTGCVLLGRWQLYGENILGNPFCLVVSRRLLSLPYVEGRRVKGCQARFRGLRRNHGHIEQVTDTHSMIQTFHRR